MDTWNKVNGALHCVKSIRIRSYSGPCFPAFELNIEIYFVSLRIHSECEKIRTRITLNTDTFHTVFLIDLSKSFDCICHDLLVVKLNAYGVSPSAMKLEHNYFEDSKERTKIGSSFGKNCIRNSKRIHFGTTFV